MLVRPHTLQSKQHLKTARMFLKSGRYAEAIALLKSQKKSNTSVESRALLGTIILFQGHQSRAENILEELKKSSKSHPEILILDARLKLRKGDIDGARCSAYRALKTRTARVDTIAIIGSILLTEKRFNRLKRFISDQLNKGFSAPELLLLNATFALETGDTDRALSYVKKALEKESEFFFGKVLLAKIYIQKKSYAQALAILKTMPSEQENRPDILIDKALCLLVLEKYQEAWSVHNNLKTRSERIEVILIGLVLSDELGMKQLTTEERELLVPQLTEENGLISLKLLSCIPKLGITNQLKQLIYESCQASAIIKKCRVYDLFQNLHYAEALISLIKILPDSNSIQDRYLFCIIVKKLIFHKYFDDVANYLVVAINETWTRPGDLARVCGNLLSISPRVKPYLESNQRYTISSCITTLLKEPLLEPYLSNCPINHEGLETLLTNLRRSILQVKDQEIEFSSEIYKFLIILSKQCFLNEYMFVVGGEEQKKIDNLIIDIGLSLQNNIQIKSIDILILSCYQPLLELKYNLLTLEIPDELGDIFRLQIIEPQQEIELQKAIKSITNIDNAVSIKVREQYEHNPYPRWRSTPKESSTELNRFGKKSILNTKIKSEIKILIAGCGTGMHSIKIAQQFPSAKIMAIDLSRASLGYAIRKTEEYNIKNIEYFHADIMQFNVGAPFDLIESVGVLHHMEDPVAGLRHLKGLLSVDGSIFLGLYSKHARREIIQVRQLNDRKTGYSRYELQQLRSLFNKNRNKFTTFVNSADFGSLSGFRDLVLHSSEMQFDLDTLKNILHHEQLEFLGFEIEPDILKSYSELFPEDKDALNLDNWHAFESKNPDTFWQMYQFWASPIKTNLKSLDGRSIRTSL